MVGERGTVNWALSLSNLCLFLSYAHPASHHPILTFLSLPSLYFKSMPLFPQRLLYLCGLPAATTFLAFLPTYLPACLAYYAFPFLPSFPFLLLLILHLLLFTFFPSLVFQLIPFLLHLIEQGLDMVQVRDPYHHFGRTTTTCLHGFPLASNFLACASCSMPPYLPLPVTPAATTMPPPFLPLLPHIKLWQAGLLLFTPLPHLSSLLLPHPSHLQPCPFTTPSPSCYLSHMCHYMW